VEPEHDDETPQALPERLARLRDAPAPAPPAALEARLRASLAARRRRRTRSRLAGVAAAVLAAAAVGLWLRPAEPPRRRTFESVAASANAPTGHASPGGPDDGPAATRGRFRPLGPADGAPFTHTARIELAAETAAYFGWPVAPDVPRARVQAEVLFGDDGVARGLRFLPASFRSLPLPSERDRQGVSP
jgi:hypothetical protein